MEHVVLADSWNSCGKPISISRAQIHEDSSRVLLKSPSRKSPRGYNENWGDSNSAGSVCGNHILHKVFRYSYVVAYVYKSPCCTLYITFAVEEAFESLCTITAIEIYIY